MNSWYEITNCNNYLLQATETVPYCNANKCAATYINFVVDTTMEPSVLAATCVEGPPAH